MSDETEAGFLARWSRRKLAARDAELPAPVAEAPPAAPEPEQPPLPDDKLELPDLDTLTGDSDFKPFLQAGVPTNLRRDALRRLWRVNPIINSLDGLDDYYCTADFTDKATVVAGLRTAYRVGRGMLDAVEQLEADQPQAGGQQGEPCPTSGRALESLQAQGDPPLGQADDNQSGNGDSSTSS